jgi:hypothetical protein
VANQLCTASSHSASSHSASSRSATGCSATGGTVPRRTATGGTVPRRTATGGTVPRRTATGGTATLEWEPVLWSMRQPSDSGREILSDLQCPYLELSFGLKPGTVVRN